jgi:LmbE family N-acetylglucosaminyl deacetylase
MTYRLAAVFAHPDDDTFSLAGTYLLRGAELDLTVIVATSGEAGVIADPSLATPENLGEVREQEQRDALAAAGVTDARLHFLHHPDGGLAGVPREQLANEVAAILQEAKPQVVVTFGPEGVTLHSDHITIGSVASEVFHQVRADATRGDHAFQRLFYSSLPQGDLDGFWAALRERGADIDPEAPFMPRGVADDTIAVRVDVRPVLKRKLEAIRAHRTQQSELQFVPEDLRDQAFGDECFVRAWPPVKGPVGKPSPDLFAGLDPA